MSEVVATAELTLDDEYLAELHREWVASLGRSFRIGRIISAGSFAASIAALAVGALGTNALSLPLGAALAMFAGLLGHDLLRHRRRWLAYLRTLPWYGRRLRIELRDDGLFQQQDLDGDPRFKRTGEVVATPNGYLVRYSATEQIPATGDAVSKERAMVYIAHRWITPPMSREEVLSRASSRGLGPGPEVPSTEAWGQMG